MPNKDDVINIDLTPESKKNLKSLAKKYRNIPSDTQSVIIGLQKENLIGDRLADLGENIYKSQK